jgi:ribosomal protein S18 acetylase RimI-like enzyme
VRSIIGTEMPTVRQAIASEVPAIARLLSRAFAEDPIERWCLACRGYRAVLKLEFLEVGGQIAPEGWLWVADPLHGVAAWIPPNASYDDSAVDAVVNPVLTEYGGDPRRVTTFWEWVESHRPDVPHWYLDFIAVDPDNRGSGCGGLLLQSGLARVDGRNESVFLVTGNPRTVPWYERFGFRTLISEDAPDDGPRVWFMIRSALGRVADLS